MKYPSVKDYKAEKCEDIRSVFMADDGNTPPGQDREFNEWFILDDVISVLQIDREMAKSNIKHLRTCSIITPVGMEEVEVVSTYDIFGLTERNESEKAGEVVDWLYSHTINYAHDEIFKRFANCHEGSYLMQSQYTALYLMATCDEHFAENWRDARKYIDLLIGGDAPEFMQSIRVMWMENNVIWDHKQRNNEFHWQQVFKDVYPKIKNVEIVDRKHDGRNIPDAWVKDKEEYIPVEVKLQHFDKSALNQLQRYMRAYKCSKGIAVAEKLTVELPENISFISHKDLMDADRKENKND